MRPRTASKAFIAYLLGSVATYQTLERSPSSLEARPRMHETRRELQSRDTFAAKTCDDCQSLIETAQKLSTYGDEMMLKIAKESCISSQKYDREFCEGAVERELPAAASVMRTLEINSTTAKQFCIAFFGVCDKPPIDEWTMKMPPMPDRWKETPTVSGKQPLQIIQYSDVHVDPLYEEGASTECKKPICCRRTKADSPRNTTRPAGPFGDHKCDTPMSLEKSMYEFIKKEFPQAAFALFTGDLVDHAVHNTSKKYNQDMIDHCYKAMHEHIDLVYGTAGNHEAHPVNFFEPQTVGNRSQWVYDSLFKHWAHEVNKTTSSPHEARAIGAYSAKYPHGNLRIISLNTNMYYRYNLILYQRRMERDPNGQLMWLLKELDAAEKAAESVYIIGHMPFGLGDSLPNGSHYFDQLVRRYSKTIKAMFFGHTHADHFQISYGNYVNRFQSNALAVSYICPSLTPTSGHPAFRVYDVDPETFAVLDATTYTADMTDAGFQKGPVWKKYYSAKAAYGPVVSPPLTDATAELTPSFWHNLTEVFDGNDSLFDEYMARKSRGWKAEAPCRKECKTKEICRLRAARAEDSCWSPSPHNPTEKRAVEPHSHGHHDSCGVPVSAEFLGALLERRGVLLDALAARSQTM